MLGEYTVLDYRCSREGASISCSLSASYNSDADALGSGVYFPKQKTVAAGTGKGSVLFFDPEKLSTAPFMSFTRDLRPAKK